MVSHNNDLDRPFHYYASQNYYNKQMEDRVDDYIRLAVDYDEIWDRGSRLLDEIKHTFLQFKDNVNNTANLNQTTLPVHFMPWASDIQIDKKLKEFEVIKEDLQRFLARIPKYTLMHKIRNQMMKDILKYRYELERLTQLILSDHRKPIYPPALINEIRPPNFRAFIHQEQQFQPNAPRYNQFVGFKVNFDYIINILKGEYSYMQIIYTVFNLGQCQLEPQLTGVYEVRNYHHGPKQLGESVFNTRSLIIQELDPSPNSYLVLEILGKPCNPKKLFIEEQIDGDGNGYPLSPDDEFEKSQGLKMVTAEGLKPIGWTAIKLFDDYLELDRGNYKVPIYETPTNVQELSDELFRQINRVGPMTIWMRLYHADEDDKQFTCHPSYSHQPKSKRDPNYKCKGFNVFIHHSRGHTPVRPIRVAFLLQFGRHILKHESGGVYFYATSGIFPRRKNPKNLTPEQEIGLIEAEYDLIGYGVVAVNDINGKMNYGDYTLRLYDGPIYLEEISQAKQKNMDIRVTFESATVKEIIPQYPPKNYNMNDPKVKQLFSDMPKSINRSHLKRQETILTSIVLPNQRKKEKPPFYEV
ncbi:UNKNOWN [Stylonychia lemnae]|uniref:Uncharacterized protein n=1 Tax=Stylonychia lemnae TaxID=5949 RepID=A0A078A1Y8_STYLE|nr:UNKNOWN [Stylonychia lemnae]|eukprot:CDW75498.1 UNKNOWN [Stylonychia lemnae]